ncbi:MAG: aldo/keto reductase [Pseudomonadota bacterium]
MKQIKLGQSGLTVGCVAYGCWRFAGTSAADARKKIETALDHGMTLIDTADIYGFGEPAGFGGAEALLGEVLAGTPGLRDRMVLATKGGITPPTPYDSSYDYLIAACKASLTRLNTDFVDLYQIHRPDLLAPMPETARALNDLVKQGHVRHIGVSNFTVSQTRALQAHLDVPIVTTQPEFSAWHQDPITDGTLDWASETGAACLAWSPLAGGRLATGQPGEEDDPVRFGAILSTLDRLADAHKVDRTTIALAFTLRHPAGIIPIIGTQRTDRIIEAATAATVQLSRRDWYDLVEARRGAPMP